MGVLRITTGCTSTVDVTTGEADVGDDGALLLDSLDDIRSSCGGMESLASWTPKEIGFTAGRSSCIVDNI